MELQGHDSMRYKRFTPIILATMFLTFALIPVGGFHVDEEISEEKTCHADRNETWTVGLIYCDGSPSPGYTLFSPVLSTTTFLIDEWGHEIHRWESPGAHRGLSVYLLEDGSILRTANLGSEAIGDFAGGGITGKIERISWEGNLEWSWEYSSMDYITHHDIEPMPNGNILAIAWEDKKEQEVLTAGRNPEIASDSPNGQSNVWPDHIIEIQPNGTDQGDIVWEWHAWDHLIQDYDQSRENFGVVADHPELLDINYVGATGNQAGRADWMHCNGIDYNPIMDQIALSCKNTNEIYIIDHSTTTEEAAGHTGGNSGKGGDFLYRWGNPQVYNHGLSSDQQLFSQHDVQWIEPGHPGEGDLILFNNGDGRSPPHSSVDVIDLPYDGFGYSPEANGTYGPDQPSWTWDMDGEMYAAIVSGVHRLPNGNTMVTYGTKGTLYEVSSEGNIVWTYVNPYGSNDSFTQGEPVPEGNVAGTTSNLIFKSRRYALDNLAFDGRELTPGKYIEEWIDQCPNETTLLWDVDGDGCIDDSDEDGILDPNDECAGHDDALDADNDSIIDGCDPFVDADQDGIQDLDDLCDGYDDSLDTDNDGLPDGCDDFPDTDNDTIIDSADQCPGYDDLIDTDEDGIPDGCDETPTGEEVQTVENSTSTNLTNETEPLNSTELDTEEGDANGENQQSKGTSSSESIRLPLLYTLFVVGIALASYASVKRSRRDSQPPAEKDVSSSSVPPLPETGLPAGLTMEQWEHQGEE